MFKAHPFNPFVDSIADDEVLQRLMTRPERERNLMGALFHAAHALANEVSDHAVPSPSGVAGCRLQQWFAGKRIPRTNPIPPASFKKMETGRHIEPFWRDVYEAAGFDVEPCPEPEPFDNFRGGIGDAILTVRDPALGIDLGLPTGSRGLLELKDLGIWSFTDYVLNGSMGKDIEKYRKQVGVYLHRYKLDFAILHGGQADNSAVTWIWQKIRRRAGFAPPFWLEILYPDEAEYARLNDRAGEVAWYIDNVDEPPAVLKDYNPEKGEFPCGSDTRPYCGWREICLRTR